jgi:hypothetical protein
MSKLAELKARRDALDKKIRDAASTEAKAKRALETRQKAIIGAWIMQNRPELVVNIIDNLTRDQDKAAFAGFAPSKTDTPRQTATAQLPVPTTRQQPNLQAAGT